MLLVIDNYDSFTYNLFQYLGELGADLRVFRNDRITLEEIEKMKPRGLVISPGPGRPENAGISMAAIEHFAPKKMPILGVCLGHQSIGQVFGGKVIGAGRIMHGKTSLIRHTGAPLFNGVEDPFEATRYHSLLVERKSFPEALQITAETAEGEIMGLQHKEFPTHGVQFHPESILTSAGKRILNNFLKICGE